MNDNHASPFGVAMAHAAASLGGYAAIARVCGVTKVSIHRWCRAGRLPRTDYTGETSYGEIIAAAVGEPDLAGACGRRSRGADRAAVTRSSLAAHGSAGLARR